MKVGDKIRIIWQDGVVAEGIYKRRERGFEVFVDENNKQFVCLPSHVKSMEVISGSR